MQKIKTILVSKPNSVLNLEFQSIYENLEGILARGQSILKKKKKHV